MSTEKRIRSLEAALPARCPHCGTILQCHVCHDWKDEALRYGLDPEILIDRLHREMEAALSGRPHDVFLSHGYDLSKLSVEELKLLRALLDKARGDHAEEAH